MNTERNSRFPLKSREEESGKVRMNETKSQAASTTCRSDAHVALEAGRVAGATSEPNFKF